MANEKRLIDANALDALEDLDYEYAPVRDGCAWYRAADVWACIENQPTVDAMEVVHGDWAVITDDCTFDAIYQCSVCKEEFVTNDGTPAENLWHYCPSCGAKMDGGNGDA